MSKQEKNFWYWAIAIFLSLSLLSTFIHLQNDGSEMMTLDVKWITLSLLPILVLIVNKGVIKSIKAFGIDVELLLDKPIDPELFNSSIVDLEIKPLSSQNKGSVDEISRIPKSIRDKKTALIFYEGKKDYYTANAISHYLELFPNLQFFQIVTKDDKFVALIPVSFFTNIQRPIQIEYEYFIYHLGRRNIISAFDPVAITETVNMSDTLLDVLKQFQKSTNEHFAVVDSNKKIVGIVSKAQIYEKFVNIFIKFYK